MKSTLNEPGRADLRRVLAQMESAAPLAPELEAHAVMPSATDRRSVVNALIGVAVVTALILPAALFWYSPADEPARAPVGAEPPVEPSTTPTTEVGQNVEWASTEFSDFVDALTVHGGRFYAISAGAVVVSDNGVKWSETGHLPPNSHVRQLISHDGLLVANGSVSTEDSEGGKDSRGTIWVSPDNGSTWSPTLEDNMWRRVISTPVGLIATGWIDLEPVGDQLPRQATVWVSNNGYDWTIEWQAQANVAVSSVADTAIWDDGLVVIGKHGPANFSEESGKSGPEWDRVVWTGPSAPELSEAGSTDILGNFEDLTATSLGHFALTYSVDPSVKDSSAVWRSDDGVDWTQVDVGAGWYYNAIAAEGSIIVIGGDSLGYAPEPEKRIWISTDGVNWNDFDTSTLPEGLRVSSVALHDGVMVAALYSNEEIGAYLVSSRIDR